MVWVIDFEVVDRSFVRDPVNTPHRYQKLLTCVPPGGPFRIGWRLSLRNDQTLVGRELPCLDPSNVP